MLTKLNEKQSKTFFITRRNDNENANKMNFDIGLAINQ